MLRQLAARSPVGVGLVLFVVGIGTVMPARGEPAKAGPELVAATLKEALQREVYGLDRERNTILASLAVEAPDYAPLRWQQGYIRDGKRGWIQADKFLQATKLAERLALYEARRAKAGETVADQLALAEWCAEHKLLPQHRAHLMRVIDLDPDNAGARAALGFVRQAGNWVSRDQMASETEKEAARAAALAEWRPKIEAIRKDLEHRSQVRREVAAERLAAIVDPAAVSALEAVFADAPAPLAAQAFDTLVGINVPEASLALARFAIFSPDLAVREAAAERLGKRDFDSFVPPLLATMYSPVVSRFMAVSMPNGRIGYRHAFAREGQEQRQVMVLDTEYRRVALVGGSARESRERAFDEAADTARGFEAAAAVQNQQTTAWNDRVSWVLKVATKRSLPAQPEAWWQWWNDHNEVYVTGEKQASVQYDARRVAIVDYVPDLPSGGTQGGAGGGQITTGGGRATGDCLTAGTLVWTIRGPQSIERMQIGDLVLSQHPDTGELAYKPVLRTTVRPKGPLFAIEAGGETLTTSGGHPFWVAGEGWMKTRDLKSGYVLHSASGALRVSAVEPAGEAETYNLVVADFNTYFVGYDKVLSHDNSVRRPTRALVPGLIAE
jgi:hypothetical protein